jgi:hypothetical protein
VFDSEQSSEFRGLSICDKGTISVNYLITKPTAGCSEVSKSRGVMKQPRCKKQPTRDDLATAWKMIRDQTQVIKLLTERLRRQERVLGSILMVYPRFEELRVN